MGTYQRQTLSQLQKHKATSILNFPSNFAQWWTLGIHTARFGVSTPILGIYTPVLLSLYHSAEHLHYGDCVYAVQLVSTLHFWLSILWDYTTI